MIEPKWERDPFGGTWLVVHGDDYYDYEHRGTVREFADSFGMNGREFVASPAMDRDVVYLIPRLQMTYICEHGGPFGDQYGPWYPQCAGCTRT